MAKKKTKTLSKLDKELWDLFARYIKLRDIKGEDSLGYYGFCCTCDKKLYVQDHEGHTNRDAQAGHYVSRGMKNVKYDEQNVHLQCGLTCNKYGNGEPLAYEDFLIETYGKSTVDRLKQARRDYKAMIYQKTGRVEILEMIEIYKAKVKELEDDLFSNNMNIGVLTL